MVLVGPGQTLGLRRPSSVRSFERTQASPRGTPSASRDASRARPAKPTVKNESKKHMPVRRVRSPQPKSKPSAVESSQATAVPDPFPEPRRQRRALSHVGGEVQFRGGSAEEQDVLLRALDVSAEEDQVMVDVHGFHSYPARLHPATARGIVEGLSKKGARVLDPFCGSGTVVVEAKALGRHALGSDLNPLAVELAWLKSRAPTEKLCQEMLKAASHVAEVAEDRRLAKADPYHRYDEEDRERYPIHVLLELDSLAHGIGLLNKPEVQRMLRLVISSMLTKLSHSEGDTTRRKAPRRLPGGFAINLFMQKTEELAARLASYRERIGEHSPRAYVGCSDARTLENVESDSIDLVVTSPPYPGVYDYLDHHLHRLKWLGLREGALRDHEIGARRKYRRLRLDEAARMWREEIGAALYEMRRTLAQDGRGVIVIADSVVDRTALRADEQVLAVAERAGIDITCIASQERPLFLHGAEEAFANRPRMEHVVVFRPGQRPHRKPKDRSEIEHSDDRSRSPRPVHSPAGSRGEQRSDYRPRGPRPGSDDSRGAQRSDYRPRGPRPVYDDSRGEQRSDYRPRASRSSESPTRSERPAVGRSRTSSDEPQGARTFRNRPSPAPRGERAQTAQTSRTSQDKTWGSKPSGPLKPRVNPGKKPR